MPSGPVQPMAPILAQANLRGMIDEIQAWNPAYPPYLCVQSINSWMRRIIDQRMWSGLLVKDQLVIPQAYTAGTANVTLNSATVTGNGTAWPTNDYLNTTLTAGPTDLNILVNVTPASMGSGVGAIRAGDWLTVDGGTGSEEQVLVVGTTASTFRANFAVAHNANATVWKSSLQRQTFIINNLTPWYFIKGVSSSTQLILSELYGNATTNGISYAICLAIASFSQDAKFILAVTNFFRRYRMRLHIPQEALNQYDPQRTATESPFILADHTMDEVGRARYEIYPRPLSAQVLGVLYYRQPANLADDEDTPPPFISTDVIVRAATADALRWRPKDNPYYDPATAIQIATQKLGEYNQGVRDMMTNDDSVYMQNLIWEYSRFPFSGFGADWYQSHDQGILMGDV